MPASRGSAGDEMIVPSGAILTAVKMVEGLGSGQEPSEAFGEEVAGLVRVWGVPAIMQAFSLLIGVGMTAFIPEDGQPDRLHLVVPAVLTRLRAIVPTPVLATMAGVLTAAAVGEEPYPWRLRLGRSDNAEALAWCYTTWLLADFIDEIILGKPGEFTRRVTSLVLDEEAG